VANTLNNLAYVRESLGRAAEAEPLYEQALEIYQRLASQRGAVLPVPGLGMRGHVAQSLHNLALVRRSLGRAAEAEPLFVQAREMYQGLPRIR